MSQHGSDGAVHWLDHGTEHPHRIALSVRSDKVQVCMRQLSEGLKAHGVQVGCRQRGPAPALPAGSTETWLCRPHV